MLLQLTVLLLASLACSNGHTVGKIRHKMQVLRMDCTVRYLGYILITFFKVKKGNLINILTVLDSLQLF